MRSSAPPRRSASSASRRPSRPCSSTWPTVPPWHHLRRPPAPHRSRHCLLLSSQSAFSAGALFLQSKLHCLHADWAKASCVVSTSDAVATLVKSSAPHTIARTISSPPCFLRQV